MTEKLFFLTLLLQLDLIDRGGAIRPYPAVSYTGKHDIIAHMDCRWSEHTSVREQWRLCHMLLRACYTVLVGVHVSRTAFQRDPRARGHSIRFGVCARHDYTATHIYIVQTEPEGTLYIYMWT